jgi:hypothetical protein
MSIAPENDYTSIFDLGESEGVNDSERLLSKICKKSFLSLWSHSNLFNDSDMHDGKGSAKELCDVLVVFGNDVIIFSDKHVAFQTHKSLDIAWKRWYKRSVAESAIQLHGAMSWLRRHPNRVFLDEKCTRPIPVVVPPAEHARYHLVAVTRGSFEACSEYFPGSLGSLVIQTDLEGDAHLDNPFKIGIVDRSKPFIHVLDEFSLEAVFREMDTIADLTEYLCKREAFLANQNRKIVSAGEEQLLASYLLCMVGDEHEFLPQTHAEKNAELVFFDESHYKGLQKNPAYLRKKRADELSYVWDDLIEKFVRIGSPTTILTEIQQSNHETEQALREMASESRFRRRVLVESLRGLLNAAAATPNKRRARIVTSVQQPERVYIFLVVPRSNGESDDEYREHRAAVLHAYCRCGKLKFPNATTFIGIGLDHPVRDYKMVSEDLMVYICHELSEEAREEAEGYRKMLGILSDDLPMHYEHDDEFPTEVSGGVGRSAKQKVVDDLRSKMKSLKRKKKMAHASRRRNRRKH